ncbi:MULTISPECIES: M16 family metallopeptidase [Shewanella]|uniref:Pitrilysin family protein n=1 Tax=Shewanella fidelis TaxID=173509 RepID=A0AAW8NTH6_9GAMM|nr:MULTISPECIES: pitrilysin family protein [Shewanella]MDR8525560.1 pitrilysin family protein [Shewanella fidelis]MDW4813121.1 pitrilysin family protein [Shewanella fidelis]MDW4816999.1 pitrilysin family protein [Shewanella fidelis]MDW4820158.1 pitrilysin family protein [Shewanella fidelis]MDW4825586.1 pitrilysin family protein [Shewanella fidelis]
MKTFDSSKGGLTLLHPKQLLTAVAVAGALTLAGCATTPVATTVDTGSFSVPAYQQVTLANGLTVYLMPQREVPLITVNATVRAGAVNDTTSGVAELTAAGLMLGAGGKTKLEIEQEVDFLGASLNSGAGKEGSYISSDFMAKDSDKMLPLIKDILVTPDFDASEFDKLRQREIAGLSQAKESPRAVINRYYDKLVFGEHPYGNATSGNRDSLSELTVNQLRAFHKSFYQPSNTAISVVGDFDPAEMQAKLASLFADWQDTEAAALIDLSKDLPTLDEADVLLVDKPDAIETTFLIGGMGISRDNPDFVGLSVINTVLGGRFTSWLNDELRVNAGLTYGARSGFSAYSASGTFKISTFTQTATTKETIDLALKTYARLWEKGLDQATLDSAKAYVKGQFPPKYETSGQLAGLMSDMYLYGFDDAFINEFQAKVDGLTLAESKRLIDTYFPQKNLQFVIIGNAAKIAPIAKEHGKVKQVNMTDVGFGG